MEIVKMEIIERLLRDLGLYGYGVGHHESPAASSTKTVAVRLYLRHIPGHQLDARLGKLRAALVVNRNPAKHVGLLVAGDVAALRCDHVVGSLPVEAASDVGQLGREV